MPRSLEKIIRNAEDLADRFENSDEFVESPAALVRHRARLADAAQAALAEAVWEARAKGVTWEKIGDAIGVRKQSAATRYRQLGTKTPKKSPVVHD